jgi:thiamine transport system ATP-binding protein
MLTFENVEIGQGDFSLKANFETCTGVTAVIGPSGAGKSTLLNAVAGFVAGPGAIMLDGTRIDLLPPAKRPVSMLFQDNNLFPHLTVRENVGLGHRLNRRLSVTEQAEVTKVLSQVGLAGMEDRKPAALSGGQQSRAALARTLLAGQPIALLDEPFSALGPGLKDEMLDLMRRTLARVADCTILMVTHDPSDAKRIADQVIWVSEGIASAPVATAALFANPPASIRHYLGEMG